MTTWKKIDGFEYFVSNDGQVKNSRGKILSPYDNGNGYLKIKLYKNGKAHRFFVHRLVGLLFVNGYEKGLTIDHLDFNRQNNDASNLEWTTLEENIRRMHNNK